MIGEVGTPAEQTHMNPNRCLVFQNNCALRSVFVPQTKCRKLLLLVGYDISAELFDYIVVAARCPRYRGYVQHKSRLCKSSPARAVPLTPPELNNIGYD